MTFIFILAIYQNAIPIPSEIFHVSDLVESGEYLFVLDRRQKTVFRFQPGKEAFLQYGKTGQGPGEFQSCNSMRLYDNKLYVIDFMKRAIIVIGTGLNFIEEIKTPFLLPRDFAIHQEKTILVGFSNKYNANILVRQYGIDQFQFGPTLGSTELLGLESGLIQVHKENILFMHTFIPTLYVYSPDGKIIKQTNLPGFDGEPVAKLGNLTGKLGEIPFSTKAIIKKRNHCMVLLNDHEKRMGWIYIYDLQGHFFWEKRIPISENLISNDLGDMYEVVYDEFKEPKALKKIIMEEFLR